MPLNKVTKERRNNDIRRYYKAIRTKNPKWTIEAIIESVSVKFYLSEKTIFKILKHK